MISAKTKEFRKRLEQLPREDLMRVIREQNPDVYAGVSRIEWVFANKLRHLNWTDGTQITGRPLTNRELALLIDEPFELDPELTEMGLNISEQQQLHIARDPVAWCRTFLNVSPRVYQIIPLRDASLRKVMRCGRRMGKSWMLSMLMLHHAYTNANARIVVVAPMLSHTRVLYDAMEEMMRDSVIGDSVTRSVASPPMAIELENGSTIKLFTSGMKTGDRSNAVRGQEAHVLVLDELDYMHPDDLIALYAMMMTTDKKHADKLLIGASTPSGQHEVFYRWCTEKNSEFTEYWYPAYCNPEFTQQQEEDLRREYRSTNAYKQEIEADWGEDSFGVYSRKLLDKAFIAEPVWGYLPHRIFPSSKYFIGVDWNKQEAGTNIVVVEKVHEDNNQIDPIFRGRLRVCYREEIPRDDFTYTKAVAKIIELNTAFNPEWIYVDQGAGDTQVELLHIEGKRNPRSRLGERVRPIKFGGTTTVRNPLTKQEETKSVKPFMVDGLKRLLETERILMPESDEELYGQLLAYVVARVTPNGTPVYESFGSAVDHAHDGLILACYAIMEHYDELFRIEYDTTVSYVSNEAFLNLLTLSDSTSTKAAEKEIIEEKWGSSSNAPVMTKRSMTKKPKSGGRPIRREMF